MDDAQLLAGAEQGFLDELGVLPGTDELEPVLAGHVVPQRPGRDRFDDNGYGALTSPSLTTVHIDAEAHGRQAARAILGLGAADLAPAPGRVIVRQSA